MDSRSIAGERRPRPPRIVGAVGRSHKPRKAPVASSVAHDTGLIILHERLSRLVAERGNPLASVPTQRLGHATRPRLDACEEFQHLSQPLLCLLRGHARKALKGLLCEAERLRERGLRQIELRRDGINVNKAIGRQVFFQPLYFLAPPPPPPPPLPSVWDLFFFRPPPPPPTPPPFPPSPTARGPRSVP